MCISDSRSLADRKNRRKHASRNEREVKFFSHWAFPFFFPPLLQTRTAEEKKIDICFFFILYSPFPYLDDERVWIRSRRVYGTSTPGFVNEAEIRQTPQNDEVESKCFFFPFLLRQKKRERLSVCQTSFNCKSEWGYKQNREQKSKKKKNRNVTSSFWLWYSIHFLFCLKSNLIPMCLIHRHLFLFFFFLNSRFITQFAYASHHFEELENM